NGLVILTRASRTAYLSTHITRTLSRRFGTWN
ncbi:hypothetical protein LINPERHAP2_LOCUS30667, partial [Linum perenne]